VNRLGLEKGNCGKTGPFVLTSVCRPLSRSNLLPTKIEADQLVGLITAFA